MKSFKQYREEDRDADLDYINRYEAQADLGYILRYAKEIHIMMAKGADLEPQAARDIKQANALLQAVYTHMVAESTPHKAA
jgi:hypothetical protein